MSNEAITWAFKQNITNSSAKFVLVVLADHADENATCFPSQKKISRMTGMGERSVRRSLEWLEKTGTITRNYRTSESGRRASDRYRLNLAATLTTGQNDHTAPPAEMTTGQNDHRQEWPVGSSATLTTGQNDHTAPPAEMTTGQNDHRPHCPNSPANVAGHEPSEEPSNISLDREVGERNEKPKSAATGVPDDFSLTDAMRSWAATHTPAVDIEFQTAQFVDYWASRGTRRADWTATWRQWMRNQAKWAAERAQNQQHAKTGYQPYRNPASKSPMTDMATDGSADPWA